MGLKKNNPGCDCCGEAIECSKCSGDSPYNIPLATSGIDNFACDYCGDRCNGTYITKPSGVACLWTSSTFYPCEGTNERAFYYGVYFGTSDGGTDIEAELVSTLGGATRLEIKYGVHYDDEAVDCEAEHVLSYVNHIEQFCTMETPYPTWTIN